jgi:hypothetical protein
VSRKTFTRDEAVEVIPDSLGRRGRPMASDWQPAVYVRTAGQRWHYVKIGLDERMVPLRRIRKVLP